LPGLRCYQKASLARIEKVMKHGIADDQAAIDQWVATKGSARTREIYNQTSGAWHRSLDNKPLAEISIDDMTHWRASIEHKSNASIRREVSTIKSLFKHLCLVGYLTEDVTLTLEVPSPEDKTAQRHLKESEVEQLISAAEGNLRNYCLIRFLYLTGARATETSILTWANVMHKQDGAEILLNGKGKKKRVVYVPPSLAEDLAELRKRNSGEADGLVFELKDHFAVLGAVRNVARVAGLPQVTPHFFRHSIATHALKNGMPLPDVARTLGHSNWKTTQKYLHLDDQVRFGDFVKLG